MLLAPQAGSLAPSAVRPHPLTLQAPRSFHIFWPPWIPCEEIDRGAAGSEKMTNSRGSAFALICALLASGSCAREEERPLDVHRVLGSSFEEVSERWGKPEQYTADPMVPEGHGYGSWPNVMGARITAFSRMGKIIWVTYRFPDMEPWDEAEAFRLVNVDPPQDQARHLSSTPGAKRWSPFEQYQKLTVSPVTKMVAIGHDPMNRVQPSEISAASASQGDHAPK